MVDVQPTENMTIDPPPAANDMPLMGNPILMRTSGRPRAAGVRASGSRASGSRFGWQVALPVAAVVVIAGAAGAYLFAKSSQTQPLMTAAPAPAATASAPAAAPPAAVASVAAPTAAPAPAAAAPDLAPRHERVTRLARAERTERHAAVRHARAASDEGADVSATAPMVAAPPPAPSAPPVISPPPAQ